MYWLSKIHVSINIDNPKSEIGIFTAFTLMWILLLSLLYIRHRGPLTLASLLVETSGYYDNYNPRLCQGLKSFVSFCCLSVCLSSCVSVCLSVSHFPQPCFNQETFT